MHSTKQNQKNCVDQNGIWLFLHRFCCYCCCCCKQRNKREKRKCALATDAVEIFVSVSCGIGCYIQMTIVHHSYHSFQRVLFSHEVFFPISYHFCVQCFIWRDSDASHRSMREENPKHDYFVRYVRWLLDLELRALFLSISNFRVNFSLLTPIFHCTRLTPTINQIWRSVALVVCVFSFII